MTGKNKTHSRLPFDSSHIFSALSILIMFYVVNAHSTSFWVSAFALLVLAVSVTTAVHHAEVIAVKVGPSLGALILALSVTVIEVGLIVSLMMNDTPESATVARDTVFAAVIIVTNGVIGVCLLLGGLKHRELGFHPDGSSSLLAVLGVLSGLTLVLPNYTTSTAGPTYSAAQLIFASVAALGLYVSLIFAQTRTHRDYFEPPLPEGTTVLEEMTPSAQKAFISFICLLLNLAAVIGLAKAMSPTIELGVTAVGAPRAAVGIVIALLVLLPETWAAISAARINQLQTSLNLALGSGAASIALTIPTVAVFSLMTDRGLTLGLEQKNIAFLVLTMITGGLTLGTGRSTALQGLVHLVLLGAFVAFSFIP